MSFSTRLSPVRVPRVGTSIGPETSSSLDSATTSITTTPASRRPRRLRQALASSLPETSQSGAMVASAGFICPRWSGLPLTFLQ